MGCLLDVLWFMFCVLMCCLLANWRDDDKQWVYKLAQNFAYGAWKQNCDYTRRIINRTSVRALKASADALMLKAEVRCGFCRVWLDTYLVTYHTKPVLFSRTSRLLTVTSWNVARFSLRKNVSGIQILFQWSSPRRTLRILEWMGLKVSRGSYHDCRRYMLTE